MKILVSDISLKHGLAAARMLALEGATVDGIAGLDAVARFSRYIHQVSFDEQYFNEQDIELFLRFLSESSYDVFLPISAHAVSIAARHKDEISRYCNIALASEAKIGLCFDKVRTAKFAGECEVSCPMIWSFKNKDECRAQLQDITFPVVIKGRNEMSDFSARYASSQEELIAYIDEWSSNFSEADDGVFPCIQRQIDGSGFGYFALYSNGNCVQEFMHRRVREVPASGGPSSCAESVFQCDLRDAGRKVLDKLKWHGVAMVEFIREESTGKLYLVEINPKFWGSLELSFSCGLNFPYETARLAVGDRPGGESTYVVGKRFQWLLFDELKHLHSSPKSVFGILLDILNWKVSNELWLRDPGPTLGRLRDAAFTLIKSRK